MLFLRYLWLKTKPREAVILATKIAWPAHGWFVLPVRYGHSSMDRVQIMRAVEASLADCLSKAAFVCRDFAIIGDVISPNLLAMISM